MKRLIAVIISSLFICQSVWAELTIEITQGMDNPTSIAIVPFAWELGGLAPEDVAQIVESDYPAHGPGVGCGNGNAGQTGAISGRCAAAGR